VQRCRTARHNIASSKGIYVETLIRASLDDVWHATQTPDEHARWDLRFSEISYLPRADETVPQRFVYSTRLGFGLRVAGEGESVGTRADELGRRTSALKFWSDDAKSLIRVGSGYWQYTPTPQGTCFLTWYDYEPRFGAAGRIFDSLVFRPLIGWATAWSFDRLRLWLEQGVDPALASLRAAVAGISRIAVAFVWIYHGLVPKLLFADRDELMMLLAAGMPPALASSVMRGLGIAEVLLGLIVLVAQRARWPFLLTVVLMVGALLTVGVTAPAYFAGAFNPASLSVALIALSAIGYIASVDLPSAARCLRRNPERAS
jgi:uncharacterized membrane protein YphA (DoxX/SURF4 family)